MKSARLLPSCRTEEDIQIERELTGRPLSLINIENCKSTKVNKSFKPFEHERDSLGRLLSLKALQTEKVIKKKPKLRRRVDFRASEFAYMHAGDPKLKVNNLISMKDIEKYEASMNAVTSETTQK